MICAKKEHDYNIDVGAETNQQIDTFLNELDGNFIEDTESEKEKNDSNAEICPPETTQDDTVKISLIKKSEKKAEKIPEEKNELSNSEKTPDEEDNTAARILKQNEVTMNLNIMTEQNEQHKTSEILEVYPHKDYQYDVIVFTSENEISMYDRTSSDSNIIGNIPNGTIVRYYGSVKNYGVVKYNNKFGYVNLREISRISETPRYPKSNIQRPPQKLQQRGNNAQRKKSPLFVMLIVIIFLLLWMLGIIIGIIVSSNDTEKAAAVRSIAEINVQISEK